MEIFNDRGAHELLKKDLDVIYKAFDSVKSRMCEKALDRLIEDLVDSVVLNLTEDSGKELVRLSEAYPDMDDVFLTDFLDWKSQVNEVDVSDRPSLRGLHGLSANTKVVRFYKNDFFIEIDGNGAWSLSFENSSWSEPETSHDEMELQLYKYFVFVGGA